MLFTRAGDVLIAESHDWKWNPYKLELALEVHWFFNYLSHNRWVQHEVILELVGVAMRWAGPKSIQARPNFRAGRAGPGSS